MPEMGQKVVGPDGKIGTVVGLAPHLGNVMLWYGVPLEHEIYHISQLNW